MVALDADKDGVITFEEYQFGQKNIKDAFDKIQEKRESRTEEKDSPSKP